MAVLERRRTMMPSCLALRCSSDASCHCLFHYRIARPVLLLPSYMKRHARFSFSINNVHFIISHQAITARDYSRRPSDYIDIIDIAT